MTTHERTLSSGQFILACREDEAATALGISLTTFRELVSEGKMPKPIRIRPRCPRYDCEDVRKAWQALKEAQMEPEDRNEWDG